MKSSCVSNVFLMHSLTLVSLRVLMSPRSSLVTAAVEERWERYLKEGVLETADLSFSIPSWASTASKPLLLSRPPEARHPPEANSVPPRFTRINRKTPEEQEATSYETPADLKQSINEVLGIQDVTNITKDWYAQSESELASAINSILQQPMEVDEAPEERSYQMPDEEAPDVLGPDPGPNSPVTATENRVLDMPADSPGLQGMEDQSPDPGPAPPADGLRDTPQRDRRSEEDHGPEVLQMKNEDQSFKFDFHVISSKCF